MTNRRRFEIAILVAALVGLVAHDVGVPLWRDWNPGDVADLCVVSFCLALALIARTP